MASCTDLRRRRSRTFADPVLLRCARWCQLQRAPRGKSLKMQAAGRHHAPRRRFGLRSMGFQPLATLHASDAVLAVEYKVGAAIGIEYRRRIGKLFNPPARLLAARAIAGGVHNRWARHLQYNRAAPARGGQGSMLFHANQGTSPARRTNLSRPT